MNDEGGHVSAAGAPGRHPQHNNGRRLGGRRGEQETTISEFRLSQDHVLPANVQSGGCTDLVAAAARLAGGAPVWKAVMSPYCTHCAMGCA